MPKYVVSDILHRFIIDWHIEQCGTLLHSLA